MKTLKSSKQKSFAIDMDMYTNMQYVEMLENEKGIFYVDYDFGTSSNVDEYEDESLRIDHRVVEEVKVIYSKEFGQYMNVVKTHSGNTYYVTL
jgi:hypothetical protein